MKENFQPRKMIYFTDGAAQHFKNKYNLINLLHHEIDFGIPVEWHFHAIAHGKGHCDGIGGNLKRLAARTSLQASSKDSILTADALYQWTKKNLVETLVFFSLKENHAITAQELKGGDTSRTFKKSKIFFLLKSIEKLFKNIIPKFYWSTLNISVERGPRTTLRLVFSKLTFFIRPSRLRANYSTDLLE